MTYTDYEGFRVESDPPLLDPPSTNGETVCSCCDEPIVQAPPEGEWSCACEWDGCDENCPIVGHLYREIKRVFDMQHRKMI